MRYLIVFLLLSCGLDQEQQRPSQGTLPSPKTLTRSLDTPDGGAVFTGPIVMTTPTGGTVTLRALDYGPDVLKSDGGLYTYLQVESDLIYTTGYLFTTDLWLTDDSCINWATGYHAICQDVGASTLGTIKLTMPYSLEVGHNIDAGSMLVAGTPVCLSSPCP